MIEKRKKWIQVEDSHLKKIIRSQEDPIDWEVVSRELERFSLHKTAKQCRE